MTAKAPITAVVSLVCFVPLAAAANPYCADILKNGVYDQYHTLREEAAFQTAKAVHCSENVSNVGKWSSTSGNVGYSAFAPDAEFNATSLEFEGQQFCKMNYEEYKTSPRYKTAVTQINLAIAAVFPQCLALNTRGVSHFVIPSQDPKTFTYRIVYTPRGSPASAKVTAWEVSNTATCSPTLKKDDVVDSAGLETVCTRRSASDPVSITATADTGGRYVARIQLLPMTEQPSREQMIARLPRQVLAAPYGDLRQGDSIASPSGNHVLTMLAAGNFVVCKAADWQPGVMSLGVV